jgi:choline-sulfatase
VLKIQLEPNPLPDLLEPSIIDFEVRVKATPKPDEFEMYNVTDDPMELTNLYSVTAPLPQQAVLAQLLAEQCAQKRLTPCSGDVLGQPMCGQAACSK